MSSTLLHKNYITAKKDAIIHPTAQSNHKRKKLKYLVVVENFFNIFLNYRFIFLNFPPHFPAEIAGKWAGNFNLEQFFSFFTINAALKLKI